MFIFFSRLKVLLRRKENLFWILLFPILLSTVEFLAFGKFIKNTPIDTIKIGLIEDKEEVYKINPILKEVFENASLDDELKLFNITTYPTYESAITDFNNKKVQFIIYKDLEDSNKTVCLQEDNSASLQVTMSVIKQTNTAIKTINKYYENPTLMDVTPDSIIANLTKKASYFNDKSSNKNATFYTIYFYSLFAMVAMLGSTFGLSIIDDIRANRSSLGIRISSSVASKGKLITIYFLAAVLLELISSLILFFYLRFLNVNLGNNFWLILLTLFLGSIAGIVFGMLIGALVNGNSAKRQGLGSLLSMVSSILAGMMSVDIKHLVDVYVPVINYINPASIITNSIYSLYYYDNLDKYFTYTIALAIFSIIGLAIIIYKMRGQKYASL